MKNAFLKSDAQHNDWNILTDADQVNDIIKASQENLQLVYKHSHTCGICHAALEEIEDEFDAINARADMHFVNVKKNRPVSDAVTKKLDVRHESPQVLIVDAGECTWHKSHWSIKGDAILEAIE